MEGLAGNRDIERAIRRSRAARSAMQRRKRRLVIAAAASVALGGGVGLSLAGFATSDAVEAAVSKAKSLAELLDQRSPGDRTEALLTKTRKARSLAPIRKPLAPPAVAVPAELANILAPPAGQLPVDLAPSLALLEVGPPTLASILTSPPGGSIVTPPGGGAIVIPPGGSSPPGGGGGVIVTPPGGGTPNQPPGGPEIPPVPEPATWAMMLLGFAAIGWRIRSVNRRVAQSLPAA